MRFLDSVSWTSLLIMCALLGLAPFVPEPHIWEKLKMLAAGDLVRAIDWFDLFFHGLPWLALGLKGLRSVTSRG